MMRNNRTMFKPNQILLFEVLKMCKEPLTPIMCNIFQQSLNEACIPTIWKTSEIIPIPKKSPPMCKNDYRPVALKSVIMKCLEKIVKVILLRQVNQFMDNYQFAYSFLLTMFSIF